MVKPELADRLGHSLEAIEQIEVHVAGLPAMPTILHANQEDHHRFSILPACQLQIHPIALIDRVLYLA